MRLKAFFCHLALGGLVVFIICLVIFGLWYPFPLYKAVGLLDIFFLLLAVDLILGPCMTLLIFKPGKKYLYFDLAVIVCFQLAALGYGVWTLAEGRPAWLVFNADRFDLVRTVDIDNRKIDQAPEQFRRPSWFGASWVAARSPAELDNKNQILLEAAMVGVDVYHHPELYAPLESAKTVMRSRLKSLDELNKYNASGAVGAVLAQWPEADAWLPLMARTLPMVVLIERSSAKVVAVVDLRPWY